MREAEGIRVRVWGREEGRIEKSRVRHGGGELAGRLCWSPFIPFSLFIFYLFFY